MAHKKIYFIQKIWNFYLEVIICIFKTLTMSPRNLGNCLKWQPILKIKITPNSYKLDLDSIHPNRFFFYISSSIKNIPTYRKEKITTICRLTWFWYNAYQFLQHDVFMKKKKVGLLMCLRVNRINIVYTFW